MKSQRNKGAGLFVSVLKYSAAVLKNFSRNVWLAFLRFNYKERIIFFALAAILIVLIILEADKIYLENTKSVPTTGGEYTEILMGDAKYFTPILAKTDAERAATRLIYSSLIKIDDKNQPQPDLATTWEISADGLQYTFHLRQGVAFHKGQSFDSEDVAATIQAIQDDANKSTLKESWASVSLETPDSNTVIFKLPKAYGPFIYNCAVGIIDSGDAVSGSLSSSYNGTGPYSFSQAVPGGTGDLTLSLKANQSYYGGIPLISALKIMTAKDSDIANKLAKEGLNNAFAGDAPENKDVFESKSFKTGRNLIVFFNLRKEALKLPDLRRRIVDGTALDTTTKLTMLALNADPQKSRAEDFVNAWKAKNLNIDLKLTNTTEYADAIKKKDYDLLMYGYDYAYDRDPYLFWHSTQIDKNNFDGYADKAADITLEDARQLVDPVERNKRYDDFYNKIKLEALAVYFENETYPYYIAGIKGVEIAESYGRPEDRFNNPLNWYIKEKRVRK